MRHRSALTALLLAGLISVPAAALHNHLTKSAPSKDQALAVAPTSIRLWFSERPEPRFSSVTLYRADSSKVGVGKAKPTDDTLSIAFEITDSLAAGSYVVSWRTAGDDGHAVRGKYSFTVTP